MFIKPKSPASSIKCYNCKRNRHDASKSHYANEKFQLKNMKANPLGSKRVWIPRAT